MNCKRCQACSDYRFEKSIATAKQMGFKVKSDPDLKGMFYYIGPNGEYSDHSYESEQKAWESFVGYRANV